MLSRAAEQEARVSNFQQLESSPFSSLSLSSFPSFLWPSELELQPSGAQVSPGDYDDQWSLETTDLEDQDPQRQGESKEWS